MSMPRQRGSAVKRCAQACVSIHQTLHEIGVFERPATRGFVQIRRRGVAAVDRIVLAGAFGSYIDPRHAMVLGLIPDCALDRVVAVGNAAGDGARIALLNRLARLEAGQIARENTHVQTAVNPNFQTEFVGAIAIPHAGDAFPHLEGILPAPSADPIERRSARRRARPAAE